VVIGPIIGSGNAGTVYEVSGHNLDGAQKDVVAKQILGCISHNQLGAEAKNLHRINQLHASGRRGWDEWVIMDKIPGKRLEDTDAFKNMLESEKDKFWWQARVLINEA
jgi:hypothetical protein